MWWNSKTTFFYSGKWECFPICVLVRHAENVIKDGLRRFEPRHELWHVHTEKAACYLLVKWLHPPPLDMKLGAMFCAFWFVELWNALASNCERVRVGRHEIGRSHLGRTETPYDWGVCQWPSMARDMAGESFPQRLVADGHLLWRPCHRPRDRCHRDLDLHSACGETYLAHVDRGVFEDVDLGVTPSGAQLVPKRQWSLFYLWSEHISYDLLLELWYCSALQGHPCIALREFLAWFEYDVAACQS